MPDEEKQEERRRRRRGGRTPTYITTEAARESLKKMEQAMDAVREYRTETDALDFDRFFDRWNLEDVDSVAMEIAATAIAADGGFQLLTMLGHGQRTVSSLGALWLSGLSCGLMLAETDGLPPTDQPTDTEKGETP